MTDSRERFLKWASEHQGEEFQRAWQDGRRQALEQASEVAEQWEYPRVAHAIRALIDQDSASSVSVNRSEYVIQLLVAAGHISQEKVNEAYELAARYAAPSSSAKEGS